ncbi:multicopper oxidase family protein [Acidiphilium sp.]|uniref:multicopper oxidase family protein n=1 Tax=Acidiphilium sp. TaxID=527 RepID=UPI003CFCCE7C
MTPPLIAHADSAGPGKRLVAGSRTLDVDGRLATVFGLTGPDGKPGITLAPGERFRVDLVNQTSFRTIIHWHGQLPPWEQDGFPWKESPPIGSGMTKSYDYAPIPGTFWMHSHQGMQEQSLMAAPLIVHSAADLRADHQEIVLFLHDFSFRSPDVLLAGLTGQSPHAVHMMAREIENLPTDSAWEGRAASASTGGGMGSMSMGSMGGGMAMGSGMDLNDIAYDAFLANDRTLTDPATIAVARNGRVRLRLINGSSSSQFWVDFGGLTGTVIAADGHAVHPVRARHVPLAIAQRLDVLLEVPPGNAVPVLATLEGSRRRTGIVLVPPRARVERIAETAPTIAPAIDNRLERRLSATQGLAPRRADLLHRVVLSGRMKPYAWSLNGEFWPKVTPLMLIAGQRVVIELVNHSMMAHPMHLHGHKFQVVAINARPLKGAVRDTILVPPMGSVRLALDADNPGRWPFHCHNLYHMMTGMMTEFRYQGVTV